MNEQENTIDLGDGVEAVLEYDNITLLGGHAEVYRGNTIRESVTLDDRQMMKLLAIWSKRKSDT